MKRAKRSWLGAAARISAVGLLLFSLNRLGHTTLDLMAIRTAPFHASMSVSNLFFVVRTLATDILYTLILWQVARLCDGAASAQPFNEPLSRALKAIGLYLIAAESLHLILITDTDHLTFVLNIGAIAKIILGLTFVVLTQEARPLRQEIEQYV